MISATASHSSNSTAQSASQDSTQGRRLGDPFPLETSASRAAPYRHEYLARLKRNSDSESYLQNMERVTESLRSMNHQARMDAMRNHVCHTTYANSVLISLPLFRAQRH